MVPYGTVARSGMELHPLGTVLRISSHVGEKALPEADRENAESRIIRYLPHLHHIHHGVWLRDILF